MAPATGRPSSSVAHRSDHATPNAAATHCTMTESAKTAERCPAVTVNRLQTLPVANGGTINAPSSGWTSRRSSCGFTQQQGQSPQQGYYRAQRIEHHPHSGDCHSMNSLRETRRNRSAP
ncbi:regulator of sigma E protease [Trypanosoma cruzi]|nr:regulator of sigma E protease [Trypanosoma cruzi]